MAGVGNWKDILRAQHEDLERLEAMDRDLDANALAADIDKILKKPSSVGVSSSAYRPNSRVNDAETTSSSVGVSVGSATRSRTRPGDEDGLDGDEDDDAEVPFPRSSIPQRSSRDGGEDIGGGATSSSWFRSSQFKSSSASKLGGNAVGVGVGVGFGDDVDEDVDADSNFFRDTEETAAASPAAPSRTGGSRPSSGRASSAGRVRGTTTGTTVKKPPSSPTLAQEGSDVLNPRGAPETQIRSAPPTLLR
jgi:hypothetical protein